MKKMREAISINQIFRRHQQNKDNNFNKHNKKKLNHLKNQN